MIFVDADAFIALNVKKDLHHSRALRLARKLEKSKEELITSWDVVDEVVTKLSYYTEKRTAIEFLRKILAGLIILVYLDGKITLEAQRIFENQVSKKVSLTDCTNMAIAKRKGIKIFFSFDKVYFKNGFELLDL